MPDPSRRRIRAFAVVPAEYVSSTELCFAVDLLRRALAHDADVEMIDAVPGVLTVLRQAVARVVAEGAVDYVMLIDDPAALPGPRTVATLVRFLDENRDVPAALPSEPRDHGEAASYATLYQFERFTAVVEAAGSASEPYDGRKPRMCLVRREALGAIAPSADPAAVFQAIADRARLVRGAYVHPFSDYYDHDRSECLPLVPDEAMSVLDVGCAGGNFGARLKAVRGCRVTGIELRPEVAAEARGRLDAVIVGDALSVEVPERFDCVTCLDTLEHMLEPERLVARVRRDFLRPGGSLVLSVPNVGHWSVVESLLAGRWDYLPAGHLCRTHVRFFTLSSIRALLGDYGFEIAKTVPVTVPPPPWLLGAVERIAGSLPVDRESLGVSVYHLVARPW